MSDLVRLRGHHLLCMLAYVGKGYTDAFTRKFDDVVAAIGAGAEIEIVAGPDDLCRTLDPETTPDYHCTMARIDTRDALALEALEKTIGLNLKVGDRFTADADLIARMRTNFKEKTIRAGCFACDFHDFCSGVADSDFACVKLAAER